MIYFAVLFLLKGEIAWSVHLWTGSIIMAGIVGLLLSYLLVPPQLSVPAQEPLEASVSNDPLQEG